MKALERVSVSARDGLLRQALTACTAVGMLAAGVAFAAAPAATGMKGAAELQDIRDIRPPFHIPSGWTGWAVIAGCCLLAGLIVAAWLWRRRRAAAVRKSAHELALERLAEARKLMVPEEARAFSIAVSDIIRTYIEQRFDIQAAHRTTPEFLRDRVTQADGALALHRERLEEFMQYCDLAKFARWVLSVPEMESMLASAIAFVSATATTSATAIDPATTSPAARGGPAQQARSPVSQLVSQTEAASS